MKLKVQNTNIKFTLQKYDNNSNITIPFKIVFQTQSGKLEKTIKEQYPDFLSETGVSAGNKLEYLKMNAKIKASMGAEVKKGILKSFMEDDWFIPLKDREVFSLSKLVTKDATARYWTDTELPYIEYEGEFKINLLKLIDYYYSKRYIYFEKAKGHLRSKKRVLLKFKKNLPLFLRYQYSEELKKDYLSYIILRINSRYGNKYKTDFERILKDRDSFKLNKVIGFLNNSDDIMIEITDFAYLPKKILTDNPYMSATVALFVANKINQYNKLTNIKKTIGLFRG